VVEDDQMIADPDARQAWVPLDLPHAIRIGLVLLGMTALAILLVVYGHYGQSRALVAVGLLGATLCGVFGLVTLGTGLTARGRGMRLDREGFAIVGRRRTVRHAWADVAEFSVVHGLRGTPLVGYTLRDGISRTHLDNVSRWLWGVADADGVVPNAPAVRPEALTAALESWRIRHQ
jgi:hypothetical protein